MEAADAHATRDVPFAIRSVPFLVNMAQKHQNSVQEQIWDENRKLINERVTDFIMDNYRRYLEKELRS